MRLIGQSPDGKIKQKDLNLLRRAARWPMTPEMRAQVLADFEEAMVIARGSGDLRAIASLLKVAVAIEGQNQADDHLAEKHARIDEGKATEIIGEPMRLTFDD